jgi:hypothetical protein
MSISSVTPLVDAFTRLDPSVQIILILASVALGWIYQKPIGKRLRISG